MTVPFSITGGSNHVSYGEITFTTTGLTNWTVPVGVTSVSIVCVGGGGGGAVSAGSSGGGGGALAYVNNTAVTAGTALSVTVGAGGGAGVNGGTSSVTTSGGTVLVSAGGGVHGASTRAGGTVLTGTGFAGGAGAAAGAGGRPSGGGGAGGYGAVGGAGAAGGAGGALGSAGTGGAGGGGWGSSASGTNAGNGGGVGVGIGSGTSGTGGSATGDTGLGNGSVTIGGSAYGAGGGGGSATGQSGKNGVVKIVWNYPGYGSSRTFPSTRVIDSQDFVAYTIATASGGGNTIVIPAGIQAGDIAILFDAAGAQSTTIPTAVTPTGWTLIDNASVSNSGTSQSVRCIVSYKTLVAADSGATVTGMSGSDVTTKTLVVFRPNQPIISANTLTVGVTTTGSQGTTGANPTNQTISMSSLDTGKNQAIMYFAHYRAGRGATIATSGATGATFTQISNNQGNGDQRVNYGDFQASETPTNATISMTSSGADYQVLQSFYLLLSIA